MTRSEDTYADTMSKRLTKRAIGKIAEKVSGELSSGFAEEVLETISAAAFVRTFADRVAFTETMWRQHYQRHCTISVRSASNSIHALHSNFNLDYTLIEFPR